MKQEKSLEVFQQKRRKFDSVAKRRAEGLEGQPRRGAGAAAKAAAAIAEPPKETKWRMKSNAFREAMKASRAVAAHLQAGRPASELPPPRMSDPALDDRVPCPHCGRRFNDVAAQRHIPLCNKIVAKPKALLRKGRS